MAIKTRSPYQEQARILRRQTRKSRRYLEKVSRCGGAPDVAISGTTNGIHWTRLVRRIISRA